MDASSARDQLYFWYWLGCKERGTTPLQPLEFADRYALFQRCDSVLSAYDCLPPEEAAQENEILIPMLANIWNARQNLRELDELVTAGKEASGGEDMGGMGVPAWLSPKPPPRTASFAKCLPPLDTEPEWRNP